ncbi:hypothetical protein C8R45DRAFT_224788 [Mycena sanguinolenta]|nr:hypothetical protein C8R45DRAFT_224788 [Mycena sanguinolenta]
MNSHVQIKSEDVAPISLAGYRFLPTPPSSDSGRTTPSEWTDWSIESAAHSPVAPYVRLPRSVRGTERTRQRTKAEEMAHYRAPSPASSPSRRIPRPPNAFILYRSDMLKKGKIPDNVERRQQNLSRVAGECWNLLSPAEKRIWQERAEERAELHRLEYPEYHFKPSPRGKGRAKNRPYDADSNDIRSLRETYLGITGPSICSSRSKKSKAATAEQTPSAVLYQSLPSTPSAVTIGDYWTPASTYNSTPSTPSASSTSSLQDFGTGSWTSDSTPSSPPPSLLSPEPASEEPALPPFFPQRTFPHFPAPRRPSTSLGFIRNLTEDASCPEGPERPSSAASETGLTNLVRDFNITPTAASFGHIAMPAPASEWTSWPVVDQSEIIRSPFNFGALNVHPTEFPEPMDDQISPLVEDPSTLAAQYLMSLDTFDNELSAFDFDRYTFDATMGTGEQ